MDKTWQAKLKDEFSKPYFQQLVEALKQERAENTVFPPAGEVFTAFEETPLDRVRCVILGQDPYHGEGQAHGMSFSVKPGIKPPPSLVNVYKELHDDLGFAPAPHGYLRAWARRGVFLLNTVLTVRKKEANSHKGYGWETFTDRVIQVLSDRKVPMVFLLWGSPAQKKAALVNTGRHAIVTSAHPSPMSAGHGFFGSKPFSKANAALQKAGLDPIDWQLPADPNAETPMAEPASLASGPAEGTEDDLDRLLSSTFG